MAKKITVDKDLEEIKKVLKTGNFIIGADRGLKNLKLGNAEKIFLASNCKEETKEDIERLAKLCKAEIIVLNMPNDELSTLCKKPFAISMLSVVKKITKSQ